MNWIPLLDQTWWLLKMALPPILVACAVRYAHVCFDDPETIVKMQIDSRGPHRFATWQQSNRWLTYGKYALAFLGFCVFAYGGMNYALAAIPADWSLDEVDDYPLSIKETISFVGTLYFASFFMMNLTEQAKDVWRSSKNYDVTLDNALKEER